MLFVVDYRNSMSSMGGSVRNLMENSKTTRISASLQIRSSACVRMQAAELADELAVAKLDAMQ